MVRVGHYRRIKGINIIEWAVMTRFKDEGGGKKLFVRDSKAKKGGTNSCDWEEKKGPSANPGRWCGGRKKKGNNFLSTPREEQERKGAWGGLFFVRDTGKKK